MAEKPIIGVAEDEQGKTVSWHVVSVGGGDYTTLCGLDGNDPGADQFGTVAPKCGQRVTCAECIQIWFGVRALRLRPSNFIGGKANG